MAEITEKSLRDVLEVRRALEELSVQAGVRKDHQRRDTRNLERVAKEFQQVVKSSDITEIAEVDVRFHDIIYTATDNQKPDPTLNNLREQMYRYRVEYLKRDGVFPQPYCRA